MPITYDIYHLVTVCIKQRLCASRTGCVDHAAVVCITQRLPARVGLSSPILWLRLSGNPRLRIGPEAADLRVSSGGSEARPP